MGSSKQTNRCRHVNTRSGTSMHTFECDDSDGSHITTSCSNHPQYFMNILPLSVPSSIFYIILACSAFFLWKKVSFLSICSQTIAGVRQYRQKKWEEREKKEIREREREKKRLEGFGENRGLMGDEQQRWGSSCLWATFLPVFHTFTCSTVAALSRLCKSLSSEEKASHSWGNKDKKRGCFQER